jgi:hypothetical protein
MRSNVYDWYGQEVMISKNSEKFARLYKAQVELHKLIIENAETSKIEAAVSQVAACDLTADTAAGRGPVTGVISWRAKLGTENDSAERATGITVAAERFPGNLRAALIHEKGSRDFHLTWHLASGQALQRSLTYLERTRRPDEVRDITDAPVAARQRTGLEAWFSVPGPAAQTIKAPPRWKQWLVSLVAAYPLVLLFQAFIAPQIKDWPLEAKSALLPLYVLTLLTYVVMPVSRLLRGWLRCPPEPG